MIVYLTYNEAPSGIFTSQVVDVVKFMNGNFTTKVKLVAFISIRNFFFNRKTIKNQLTTVIVLPMFPKMENWRYNVFLLKLVCFILGAQTIISRSVIATKLALLVRDKKFCKKVVYDGRGAIASEWKEYEVVKSEELLDKIEMYEKEAIQKSDFRIAVSNSLVNLWQRNYDYCGMNHVIIPCTLNAAFSNLQLVEVEISAKRNEIGLNDEDIVFVYSGSVAGWQSFGLMQSFLEPLLQISKKNKMLFFSPAHSGISAMQQKFPEQVFIKHLKSSEVQDYLIVGDYGLLIREQSETNEVASPVKYAEYLCCGLKVIISENLGDYTKLTAENNWGAVYTGLSMAFMKPSFSEKLMISQNANRQFSKINYKVHYQTLINQL